MLFCFITKDIVEYYSKYLKLNKHFIYDIFAIWCGPKGTLLEFLNALNSKTDRIKLIVLAKVASLFWICFSIEIPLQTCHNFPPFKSLLTNICTYHSSLFTPLAIRRPSLKGNLWGMLETVLPLIHFMKQGKSSGSDYELGGIHSDFCFHCFLKYDAVAERNGFTRSLRVGLACVGLLSLRLPLTVVTHVLRMLLVLSCQN